MNFQTFNKTVFRKGLFRQFCASPYFGSSDSQNQTVILSDQIEKPTYVTFRKRKEAFIVPYTKNNSIGKTISPYFEEIQRFTGCLAPFFTLTDLDDKNIIFNIREISRSSAGKEV